MTQLTTKHNPLDHTLAVRRFNRFYTKAFGLLQKRLLDSPYSLAEARVLYDLANHAPLTARDIAADLTLDPGYLSRILKRFETDGLLRRERCTKDGRSQQLSLSPQGRTEAARMADLANEEVGCMMAHLNGDERDELVRAMQTVESTLTGQTPQRTLLIRDHRPGDAGWVIEMHSKFYAREYGFNQNFEALVARIVADFLTNHDAARERFWVAEMDGKPVGSIFLVRENNTVAKLRLLLLAPEARGLGLGNKLVEECISFAHNAGYSRVELWTNAVLSAARHLYEKAGFYLVREETHTDFGMPQLGQFWRLDL